MKVNIDDVCENVHILYDIVGDEKFLEITRMYGGTTIYIPTYKSATRNARNREIIDKFNGVNINALAREYNLTANQIKMIVKDNYIFNF